MTAATLTHIHHDATDTAWIDDPGVEVILIAREHIGHGWSADTIHENHPALTRALLAPLGESPAQRRFRQIKAAAAPWSQSLYMAPHHHAGTPPQKP